MVKMLTDEEIHNRYTYHPPDDAKKELHQLLRNMLEGAALWVEANLSEGREKSVMHTKLEEAMFWGNASIARK